MIDGCGSSVSSATSATLIISRATPSFNFQPFRAMKECNSIELGADLMHKMVELNSLKYVQKPLVRQANHMQKVVLTVAFEYSDLHYGDS